MAFRADKMSTAYAGDQTGLVPHKITTGIGDVMGNKSSYAGAARQVKAEARSSAGLPKLPKALSGGISKIRVRKPRLRFFPKPPFGGYTPSGQTNFL